MYHDFSRNSLENDTFPQELGFWIAATDESIII